MDNGLDIRGFWFRGKINTFGDSMCFLPAMDCRRLHDLNISTSVEVVDHTNVKYYNFGVTRLAWHRFGCISSLKYMLEEACSHWWIAEFVSGICLVRG